MAWSNFRDVTYTTQSGAVETAHTHDAPALAVDADRNFHLVFSDLKNSGYLRHIMRGRSDAQWREVWGLARQKMRGKPSTVFVGDTLHVVSVTPQDRALWHASKRGDRVFDQAARVPGARTNAAVSLAAHGNTLHMVHHDQFTHGRVWHTTFQGRWSGHDWVNQLTSRIAPIITHAGSRLQIWTTDKYHRCRVSTCDPRFETRFRPFVRLQHPTHVTGTPVIHGVPRANAVMLATAAPTLPFVTQTNPLTQYMFSRGQDDGNATARVNIPQAAFSVAPAIATSGSNTMIVGRGFNRTLREAVNTRSEIAKVGIAFKIHDQIADDFRQSNRRMKDRTLGLIRGLNAIYKPFGLSFFERTAPELLDLPASFLEVNAGRCLLNSHSDEQRALFSNRNGMQRKDIGVYVVERITKVDGTALGGCGSPRLNACMVVPWCSAELLGHEVGHALGLKHTGRKENLMTPDMPAGTTQLLPLQVEAAMKSDSICV